MLQRLRQFIPEKVAGVVSNCGGTNLSTSRFAGHLLDPELTEERFAAICHCLIFANGVRKSTQRGRNLEIVRSELDHGRLPGKKELHALDIGASGGLDALATYDVLKERYVVRR